MDGEELIERIRRRRRRERKRKSLVQLLII